MLLFYKSFRKRGNRKGGFSYEKKVFIRIFIMYFCKFQGPQRKGAGRGGGHVPHWNLKLYFARNVFLEIRFYVIHEGIQNFLSPSTPKILSGGLHLLGVASKWAFYFSLLNIIGITWSKSLKHFLYKAYQLSWTIELIYPNFYFDICVFHFRK